MTTEPAPMSKLIRITFRNGDVRMGNLPNDRTLPQLWSTFKRDGAIVGEQWCAQFDHVAMIEVAGDASPDSATRGVGTGTPADQNVAKLAIGMGIGAFKPPGEA